MAATAYTPIARTTIVAPGGMSCQYVSTRPTTLTTTPMMLASVIGVVVSVVGLVLTYWQDIPPGATIVVLAIVVYGIGATFRPLVRRPLPPRDPHPDMVDDVELEQPSRTIAE